MEKYYSLRAKEYEEIYHRPDSIRQEELSRISNIPRKIMVERHVLEVACGTGYWTQIVAEVAQRVEAIDTSDEMLAIARAKGLPREKIRFCTCDAYVLDFFSGTFDAGLANFWLSHVPKSRLNDFPNCFHRKLEPRSIVFMADNVYVEGLGGELIEKPGCDDTFKLRKLSNGSRYEVLKNYYNENQLCEVLEPFSSNLTIRMGDCFWWLSYLVP